MNEEAAYALTKLQEAVKANDVYSMTVYTESLVRSLGMTREQFEQVVFFKSQVIAQQQS